MSDILHANIPQAQFNTLIIQLLLDIKSRQIVLQKRISEQIAIEQFLEVFQVFEQIEREAALARTASLTELYGQFGELYPDILKLLDQKNGNEI